MLSQRTNGARRGSRAHRDPSPRLTLWSGSQRNVARCKDQGFEQHRWRKNAGATHPPRDEMELLDDEAKRLTVGVGLHIAAEMDAILDGPAPHSEESKRQLDELTGRSAETARRLQEVFAAMKRT